MAPLGKIDMSVFEKKNGNKRTRPRMARPSIDSKQEIIEYNQEKERIEQFFADKDDPHISLIVDITLLNSHPDVIEEIRQAFRRRYLHSPYVIIYMLSSDRNQCGETTILNETGLDAFNEALRHRIIIFETVDCKNLEPGIDPTIRINQLVSLAKYHQEGSFETCIVTEDKSLVSLAYNLEVACMSYGSLYEELVKYKEYCRKGNSCVVEGNLDWGLLLPEHMYEYPLSYHEYQVEKPSLNSFIDRFADYQDEKDEGGGQEQLEDVQVCVVPSIVVESDSGVHRDSEGDEQPKEEESPSSTKERPKGGAPRKIWYYYDYPEEYVSKKIKEGVWDLLRKDVNSLVYYRCGNSKLSQNLKPETKEKYAQSFGAALILCIADEAGFTKRKLETCTDSMGATLKFLSNRSSIQPYLDVLLQVFLPIVNKQFKLPQTVDDLRKECLARCKKGAGKAHVEFILNNYKDIEILYNNGIVFFTQAFGLKTTRKLKIHEKVDQASFRSKFSERVEDLKGDDAPIDNSYETFGDDITL